MIKTTVMSFPELEVNRPEIAVAVTSYVSRTLQSRIDSGGPGWMPLSDRSALSRPWKGGETEASLSKLEGRWVGNTLNVTGFPDHAQYPNKLRPLIEWRPVDRPNLAGIIRDIVRRIT